MKKKKRKKKRFQQTRVPIIILINIVISCTQKVVFGIAPEKTHSNWINALVEKVLLVLKFDPKSNKISTCLSLSLSFVILLKMNLFSVVFHKMDTLI